MAASAANSEMWEEICSSKDVSFAVFFFLCANHSSKFVHGNLKQKLFVDYQAGRRN